MKRTSALWSMLAAGAIAIATPLPAFADTNGDLVAAAAHGDTAKVIALLGKGADVNVHDNGGYTPLIWAALNGHDAVVGELLRRGADVHARDKEGYTALMWAAQNHRADAVRALLAHGASPNETDKEGYTALTWTAQDGQPGIALDLILGGSDVNLRDHAGYTALMWAAQQGHNSVVKLLLANGANPNIRDYKGFSALDLAIAFNRADVREYLTHVAPQTLSAKPVAHYVAPRGRRGTVRGVNRGAVVAVVGTPGVNTTWTPNQPAPQAAAQIPTGYFVNGQWVATNPAPNWTAPAAKPSPTIDDRILSFDTDGNRVVDGRDWRTLTPARRLELANILWGVRHTGNFGASNQAAAVRGKLDWVYADASRLGLTLNMAYDFPTPNSGKPTW